LTQSPVSSSELSTWALLKRLYDEHGRLYTRWYILALVLMSIGAIVTAYSAYLLKPVVNGMMGNGGSASFATIRLLAYTVGGLFVVRGLATFGHSYILARIGNQIIASLQNRVFAHLLAQPVGYFQNRHSSEFVTRLANSANSVRDALQILVTTIGRDFLTVSALLIQMFIQDTTMTLIAICVLPVGTILLRQLGSRVKRYSRRSIDGSTQIMELIQETVRGIRIVKSFNYEPAQQSRMSAAVQGVQVAANRIAASMALSSPIGETLSGLAVAAVVLYGGWRVTIAHADPGSFVSFIGSLLLCYDPAKRLGRANLDLQNSLTSARLLYEVLDLPLVEGNDAHKPALVVATGEITFNDVSFRYRAEEPVLRGASLTAQPHKTTALVGPSGGGKSTIINLLQRFYEPESGSITIDGLDIRDCTLKSLRENIAYVSQDVFLFRGTIAENIAYGRAQTPLSDIAEAARKANAHDFIMGFAEGYGTNVGEQGTQLSGGQRQRIAIARAILKNAPIILLDEPTAALDSESEREVQKALDDLRKERTTIVVAHRLQTIFNADRICVIEGGCVVESGTHDELLKLGGAYFAFFSAQFGAGVTPVKLPSASRPAGGADAGRLPRS